MRRYSQFIILLGVVLGLVLSAGGAQATTYYWDADCTAAGNDTTTGAGLGGTGTWVFSGITPNSPDWYNGSADVTWPNNSGPRDDAVFTGTAGTVTTTNGKVYYVGDINVQPTSGNYTMVVKTGSSGEFHFNSFSGSGLAGTTWSCTTSTQFWYMDGATPTTLMGAVTGSGPWWKYGAGTLILNLASGTNLALGCNSGPLILDGTWSTGTGSNNITCTGATGSVPTVLAGAGTITAKGTFIEHAGETAGKLLPGVLSPGDCTSAATYTGSSHVAGGLALPTYGVGVLTLNLTNGSDPNKRLAFSGSTSSFADCASILLLDIQGNAGPGVAGGYDQVAVTSSNNASTGCVFLDYGAGNTVGAKLVLNWDQANYAGSRGDYLKLINVSGANAGQIKNNFSYPDTGATINNFDCVIFTNKVGKGFLFQYRYNFDTSGTQNDFGLYDNETLVASAGGAYTNVGASSINLNGSATIDSGVGSPTITAWNWDFDNNSVTDLTGQNPSVNNAYFKSTFGWTDGSTHNIVLNTVDSDGVSSWGTTTLTLSSGAAPEPATWALMGTGALIAVGFARRKRMR